MLIRRVDTDFLVESVHTNTKPNVWREPVNTGNTVLIEGITHFISNINNAYL